MIIPDHKKVATIIVSRMGKDGGLEDKQMEAKPEEEMDDSKEGLKSAAEEMMMAVESKSPHDFMNALCSFLDQYDGHEDSEEDGEADLGHDDKLSDLTY